MIKEDKTNSETSNIITIKIGNIFSDISWQIKLIMIILFLMVIYLILRIYIHVGSDTSNRLKRNKILETEKLIHKSFDILRDDVNDYEKKKLTIAEKKRLDSIENDISDAEKIISKEIKDI